MSERTTDLSLSKSITMEKDVLRDIAEFLEEEYDPAAPAIQDCWVRLFRGEDDRPTTTTTSTSASTTTSAGASLPKPVPRVGTSIQRSDAANRRKQAWLLETPPPPPARRPPAVPPPRPPTSQTDRPSLQPARVMGPLPPPPVQVEVRPGTIIDVPFFTVHVSRQYKARLGAEKYHLRFNRDGQLRSVRRK